MSDAEKRKSRKSVFDINAEKRKSLAMNRKSIHLLAELKEAAGKNPDAPVTPQEQAEILTYFPEFKQPHCGGICDMVSTASRYPQDLEKAGKNKHPTFLEKYLFWRECNLRLAFLFFIFVALFNMLMMTKTFVDYRNDLIWWPPQLRETIGIYKSVTIGAQLLVDGSSLVAIVCVWEAIHMSSYSRFHASRYYAVVGFAVPILTPIFVWAVVPYAQLVQKEKVWSGLCALVLPKIANINGLLRNEYIYHAHMQGDPWLAAAFQTGAPDHQYYRQWCWNHGQWDEDFFSTGWVVASRNSKIDFDYAASLNRDPRFKPGIFPPSLYTLAHKNGVYVNPSFQECWPPLPTIIDTNDFLPPWLAPHEAPVGQQLAAPGSPAADGKGGNSDTFGLTAVPGGGAAGVPGVPAAGASLVDFEQGGGSLMKGPDMNANVSSPSLPLPYHLRSLGKVMSTEEMETVQALLDGVFDSDEYLSPSSKDTVKKIDSMVTVGSDGGLKPEHSQRSRRLMRAHDLISSSGGSADAAVHLGTLSLLQHEESKGKLFKGHDNNTKDGWHRPGEVDHTNWREVAASLKLQLGLAIGQASICGTYNVVVSMLKFVNLAFNLLLTLPGWYVSVLAISDIVPKLFSIIGAVNTAVMDVKLMMPHSVLPAYVGFLCNFIFLPFVGLLAITICQGIGDPFIVAAGFLHLLSYAFRIQKCRIMLTTDAPLEFIKQKMESSQLRMKLCDAGALCCVIAWAWTIKSSNPELFESLKQSGGGVLFPMKIVNVICGYFANFIFTEIVSNDVLLTIMLDDDSETGKDEEVITDWARLTLKWKYLRMVMEDQKQYGTDVSLRTARGQHEAEEHEAELAEEDKKKREKKKKDEKKKKEKEKEEKEKKKGGIMGFAKGLMK